jgi:hypothetical protein
MASKRKDVILLETVSLEYSYVRMMIYPYSEWYCVVVYQSSERVQKKLRYLVEQQTSKLSFRLLPVTNVFSS